MFKFIRTPKLLMSFMIATATGCAGFSHASPAPIPPLICNTIKLSSDKRSYKKERLLAEKFLEKEINDIGLDLDIKEAKDSILLAAVDLNNDGTREILFSVTHSIFCGVQNCNFYVLSVDQDTPLKLLEISIIPGSIYMPNSSSHLYRSLLFKDNKGLGSIWEFDGSTYRYKTSLKSACDKGSSSSY